MKNKALNRVVTPFIIQTDLTKADCYCGLDFYCADVEIWRNKEGELEGLQSTSIAALELLSTFKVEGREYVTECDCWHERMTKLKRFLDTHVIAIATYINKEKQYNLSELSKIPDVKE